MTPASPSSAGPDSPGPDSPGPDSPGPATPAPVPAPTPSVAARAVGLTKVYGRGDTTVKALDGVTVEFATGQFSAIMGPSGSGKSTLMHCMAGLDRVTGGQTYIGDTELSTLPDKELTRLRRDKVGFVFQAYNLVPTLTALENITLPLDIAGREPDQAWIDRIIDTIGLRPRLSHLPSQLSGGQQQRVAAARALASQPPSSSPTSPPATSTPRRPPRCSTSSAGRCPTSGRRSSW